MIPRRFALLALAFFVPALTAPAAVESRGPAPASQPVPVDLLGDAFQGIAFGDTQASVTQGLEGQCDELKRIAVERPSLPLARETQTHLIALGVHAVGVDEVAFTFADDALVLVEVRGGVVDGLLPVLEAEPMSFLGYAAWLDERVVAIPEQDVVWLMGPEALHPHLFLWENPDLPSVAAPAKGREHSASKPAFLEFGAALEDLQPRIEAACPRSAREEIERPWLPTKPLSQVQVNCYGVDYAGFPRKVEAVFGDGKLQLAWILTGKGEEERLRRALTEVYGEARFVSQTWEVFDEGRVSLRKDKPEVLMIAEELVPFYREQIRATGD